MTKIQILKLVNGEEVIAHYHEPNPDDQYIQIEYPLVVEWDVDPDTGYPDTELYPFLYGMKIGSPVFVPARNLLAAPVDPSNFIKQMYVERVEKIAAQAESLALAERERSKSPKRRLGR